MFAWSTAAGAEILLDSPDFEPLLTKGSFDLYVGTDTVTDQRAIDRLQQLSARHAGLSVRAVVNASASLFHPKLAWFADEDHVHIVIGSGNLTKGGLLANWEAFTVVVQPIEALGDLRSSIDDWLADIEPGVMKLDDPLVLEAVAQNKGFEASISPKSRRAKAGLKSGNVQNWLVAELNKSRKNAAGKSMFSQASFDKSTFQQFFDFSGAEIDILLYPIADSGAVTGLESTKGRFKQFSINYYIELRTVQGVPYPAVGRPIAIFGRLLEGGYIYKVLLPGQSGHGAMSAWLNSTVSVPNPSHMKRIVTSTADIRAVWPENPLLNASLPAV